ncbi:MULTISPECIES: SAM-dependent methyltransferase [Chroococcidiopsis]|uniref:RNA methylase n=2 Tax=Chroococcidiopsis TaxID=54298 RepID=K9U5W9_CHRTP|nr:MULTISPECIES: class I SAM-dependent methyltransferase [Chroococcidiopsis]AFY89654.1 RNA methylase [Chroococcidiopsis thermalis PCC 7203]PSB42494.1 class I SAM-dependent methyltransferase [Cyanosarcina cf. burmensis CCALA 770]URD49038.1 class I SAM-dependent methyltransferase [Chroococcidiopsis sp. CCNUC1]
MQLQKMLLGIVASTSVVSLGIAGCTPPELKAEAQTPTSTTQSPATAPTTSPQEYQSSIPYVPTPQPVVDAMLKIANVGKDDIIYDLGSGDGRIPVTAAQRYGARGVGIEIDPELVAQANQNAKAAGVSDRVQFRNSDLFKTDMSEATVVTLYLLTENNIKLRPKLLQELKPGTRIVSHNYGMGDWKPERVEQVDGRTIYLWTVPEREQRGSDQRPATSDQ